jgi:uroporphyrinogen decarboxylase
MPFDVPPENVAAISALIHGEIACFMESGSPLDDVTVDLPDYTDTEHVYVDVVTLDSSSCAPCQYMMEAVEHAAGTLGSRIIYQEHKIKSREGIVAMKKLGVTNLPTIVIDGVVSFISVIPDEATFIKTLKEAMAKKSI